MALPACRRGGARADQVGSVCRFVCGGGVPEHPGWWTLLRTGSLGYRTSTVVDRVPADHGSAELCGDPVAIGFAVLKYRLYEIDMIINRTLVYGSLTATLVVLYFGGIVVLQRVFVLLTGQRSTLAVVASTLLIAALFNPLRRRIQS